MKSGLIISFAIFACICAAQSVKTPAKKYIFSSTVNTNNPNAIGYELQVKSLTNRIANKDELIVFLKSLPDGSAASFEAQYAQFKVRLGTNILSQRDLAWIFKSNNVPLDPVWVPDF